MLPQVSPLPRINHRLEHGTENIRVNIPPLKSPQLQQQLAGAPIKHRHILARLHRKQPPVHVREAGSHRRLILPGLSIQSSKNLSDHLMRVATVLQGEGPHRVRKLVRGKHLRILGKKAEQQAGEKRVQVMAAFRGLLQRRGHLQQLIKKYRHLIGSLPIRVMLRNVGGLLHARPRQEKRHILANLRKRGAQHLAGARIVSQQPVVVSYQHKPRAIAGHMLGVGQLTHQLQQLIRARLARHRPKIHHVLLGHLARLRIPGNIQIPLAQARNTTGRTAIRRQQIIQQLLTKIVAPGQRTHALLKLTHRKPHSSPPHSLLHKAYRRYLAHIQDYQQPKGPHAPQFQEQFC